MSRRLLLAATMLAVGLPLGAIVAQDPRPTAPATPAAGRAGAEEMIVLPASAVKWAPLTVPGFTPGIQIGVIAGDPSSAGKPYTIRLRFPDGYEFPAHWHPMAENLTVLSGTFRLGMGERADAAALTDYSPGDYLLIPGRMAHFGKVRGETTVQLHGVGPFEVHLAQSPKP